MAYTSNIAAINAANQALKAAGYDSSAAALKQARAKHFKIEKVDGEWHALIKEPLPSAQSMAQAIASSNVPPSAPQDEPEQAQPDQAMQAQAAAMTAASAAFFASRAIPQAAQPEAIIPEAEAENEPSDYDLSEHRHESMGAREFEKAQAAADALANQQQAQAAATSQLRNGKVWIHASTCESPVKRVWAIADAMVKQARDEGKAAPSRKDIQDECVRQGVASGTARTQYQAWKKANDNDAANAANAAALSAALNARAK